ncbi:hypothetical protein amyaer_4193 [Microcystis aeruginosa NIES-2481]|nr:hypothetical protein amyaer_4193 [Microcystis aeruginosa NIES-2481]
MGVFSLLFTDHCLLFTDKTSPHPNQRCSNLRLARDIE